MPPSARKAAPALVTLILSSVVMLTAVSAGVRPHPPQATLLFGIAPVLGQLAALLGVGHAAAGDMTGGEQT